MLIKILKSTVCSGENVIAGSEIETDKGQAKLLIRMGKAVAVDPVVAAPVKEVALTKASSVTKSEEKIVHKKSNKKSGSKKSSKLKEE